MYALDYFKPITTFLFDVDGVLTDGRVVLLENGLQARSMNVKDGLALQLAMKNGYRVIIISGAYSEPVLKRMQYLGIAETYLAIKDKKYFIENYLAEHNLDWNELLFMGDDLPDLPLLEAVGLSTCPADAAAEVRHICKYISTRKGGDGCVRDVIEKVLKLNGQWQFDVEIASR